MSSETEYPERYCAYVDILGFRGVINELGRGTLSVFELRDLLTIIHSTDGLNTTLWKTEFRKQSISDALAISTKVSSEGLSEMLRALENLTLRLLERGYFVRGGLVKGRLFHDDNVVFGDALVEAHRLESEVAIYPRIMATRAVWLDFEKYRAESDDRSFDGRLTQADDGPMFVHTLRAISQFAYRAKLENINLSPPEQTNLDHITDLQHTIQKRLDASIDNPRHFQKVQWFARYWNQSVPFGGRDFSCVQGPGLNDPSDR